MESFENNHGRIPTATETRAFLSHSNFDGEIDSVSKAEWILFVGEGVSVVYSPLNGGSFNMVAGALVMVLIGDNIMELSGGDEFKILFVTDVPFVLSVLNANSKYK